MSVSPFDAEAARYDADFTESAIGARARARVWRLADAVILPGMRVLELGGGTGEDACHFAARGAQVFHTDASERMVAMARAKAAARGLTGRVTCQVLDMGQAGAVDAALAPQGPFDAVFSNFGALNCVGDLPGLAAGLAGVLRPGAPVLCTVMGPWVPWEWGWYLAKRDPGRAFRRLRRGGTAWRGLQVYYPAPAALARAFAPHFRLRSLSVVNAFLPPSYCEAALGARTRLLDRLDRLDERLIHARLLARFADHYLAHLERV